MTGIDYTVADGVATVRLDRPDRRNAFTMEMIDAWAAALRAARTDDAVRVVVLTGAGDAFCSGTDTSVPPDDPSPMGRKTRLTERVHQVLHATEELDKPIVAAVNGVAVGAGMDFALACDIRIAARSARFSQGYITVGLVPGDGGCWFLPRLVGMARALELMWTGEFVDADDALAMGLVSRVVPDDELPAAVDALARRLAAAPPMHVRMIKRAAYQGLRTDLRTSLDLISSHLAVVSSTDDAREAVSARLERREPAFRGR